MGDQIVYTIDSDEESGAEIDTMQPINSLMGNQLEIEKLILARREMMKKNPIRTILMIKTEAYVEKYNEKHPEKPITSITEEVLNIVANKIWSQESKEACTLIHQMEQIEIAERTVPTVSTLLGLINEKGKLVDEERRKLASTIPKSSESQAKKRRFKKPFRHLIPNVYSTKYVITLKADGKMKVEIHDKTETSTSKNVSDVPTIIDYSRTVRFTLPEHILCDADFHPSDVMAFYSLGNIEIVCNAKPKSENPITIPIHFAM